MKLLIAFVLGSLLTIVIGTWAELYVYNYQTLPPEVEAATKEKFHTTFFSFRETVGVSVMRPLFNQLCGNSTWNYAVRYGSVSNGINVGNGHLDCHPTND